MAFNATWKFNIVPNGGILSTDILNWINAARIPAWFTFSYDETIPWTVDCGPDYGCWPQPEIPFTFVVVREGSTENGISMKNAVGLTWEQMSAIQSGYLDSPETVGLRIWHETLHAMGANPDLLDPDVSPNDIAEFKEFVAENSVFSSDTNITAYLTSPYNHPPNPVLRAYYYMLMVKRLGCPELPIPAGPATVSLWQRLIEWILAIFHV